LLLSSPPLQPPFFRLFFSCPPPCLLGWPASTCTRNGLWLHLTALFPLRQAIYGQDHPPEYSLSAITAPVITYWSLNDWLASPSVRWISKIGT
jgi:hypothetical protein